MNNEKAKNELTVSYKIDDNEIRLTPSIVQQYLVGSDAQISLPEFKLFTELCKVRRLNPFLKEAYIIKYGNEPAQIVVGKDVMVKRAVRHPQYDGKESGIIVMKDNEVIERNGCFFSPEEIVVGGWCKVHRKDRKIPEYMSVAVEEVAVKKRDGTYNTNWKNKTATMVEKVAKVRALREAFVEELQGMYEPEEFNAEIPQDPVTEAAPIETSEENAIVCEAEEVKEVDIHAL